MSELVNLQVERTLLGAIMCTAIVDGVQVARDMVDRVPLESGDFSVPAHAEVYGACQKLLREGAAPEPILLSERLRAGQPTNGPALEASGIQWLAGLQREGEQLLTMNFESYARQVRELAMRRRVCRIARAMMADACQTSRPLEQLVQQATNDLNALHYRRDGWRTLRSVVEEILDELHTRHTGTAPPIIHTGIRDLDAIIGGLQPTLTVVGGLPGAGKSALFATLVQNLAKRGVKVGIFSLEDEGRWLGWRLMSDASGVENFVLRNRRLNAYQMDRTGEAGEKVWGFGENVFIDDRPGMTASDIVEAARRGILTKGIQVVLVDHLGEVKHEGGRRDRHDLELADALSQLRSIAKTHHVPVVVAAHLNRKADEKAGQEPRLSNFANASAIEQKARVALGLCREPGSDTLGVCILKNTNGRAGIRVDLAFHGAAAMIRSCESMSPHEEPARET